MADWQMQQARDQFGELYDRALVDGPQTIKSGDKAVAVVLSVEDYNRLAKRSKTFVEHILNFPKVDFELPKRAIDPPRDFSWLEDEEDAKA